MLFQRINRDDPEKVFMVVKAGENLLANRPVVLHFDGTDDGLDAFLCNATEDSSMVIGLADTAIASGEFGLVQVYGYRASAIVHAKSNLIVDNHAVMGVNCSLSGYLSLVASIGAQTAAPPWFVCAVSASIAASTTSGNTTTAPVFIRCL